MWKASKINKVLGEIDNLTVCLAECIVEGTAEPAMLSGIQDDLHTMASCLYYKQPFKSECPRAICKNEPPTNWVKIGFNKQEVLLHKARVVSRRLELLVIEYCNDLIAENYLNLLSKTLFRLAYNESTRVK